MAKKRRPSPEKQQPIYWFAILDSARERGDFAAAAEAQRELEHMGITVRYRRQTREAAPCP